ncbi:ABC transporter ATP-binding protein [Nocardia sp. NPDC051570]|uniref:ABC transporter ATP-binding protein n=1 Tax=Nocardia sp. NPDC051570 TaxID=3364324 RepID=UPI0037A31ACD
MSDPVGSRPRAFALAPELPVSTAQPCIDETTTARQLVLRAMIAHRRLMIPAVTLSVLHQVGEMLVPVVVAQAVDSAVATGDVRVLAGWIAVLALVFATLSLSFRFASRLGWLAMNFVDHSLRMRVIDRIFDAAGLGGPSRQPGELLSIATVDTQSVARAKAALIYPFGQLVGILLGAAILVTISWPLGVAAVLGAVIVVVASDRIAAPVAKRMQSQQAAAASAAASAADIVAGLRVIRGMGAEHTAFARYRRASQNALAATHSANRAAALLSARLSGIGGLFVVAIGVYAAALAVDGQLSIGELITVIGISQLLIDPMSSLGKMLGLFWNAGLASAGRILAVVQAPPLLPAPSITGPASIPAATELSFELGDRRIALRSGTSMVVSAPHSDVAPLVAGLALEGPVTRGRIRLGGDELVDLGPAEVRRRMVVAPHEAQLFEGTILENVTGGDAGAPTAAQERALLAAGLGDVLAALPDGVETPVGEGGFDLSGGQRQRVALARALIADPEILVLVDPTTGVDSVTETAIAAAVVALRAGRSTLVLTYSPAWRAAADTVADLAPDTVGVGR